MKTNLLVIMGCLALGLALGACASVDITKTAKGYYAPTNPNEVEVLMTKPDRQYTELGTITVTGFDIGDTAKMHNAIRAKAAPLGATAVILTSQGIAPDGFGGGKQWAIGVAIHYN
jgi:hypothetical protein